MCELRVRLPRRETGLSSPVKYFYGPFQGGSMLLLWTVHIISVLFLLYAFVRVFLLVPCCHLLEKGSGGGGGGVLSGNGRMLFRKATKVFAV